MKTKVLALITIIASVFVSGCKEAPLPPIVVGPDNGSDRIEAPAPIQAINQFIKLGMEDAYLWYNTLPDIDIRYEFDSFDYFDKLLYEEDKWSYVTDDRQALENSFRGIEKSYGWSLSVFRISNTESLLAIVEFVYPNTPASEKGLKRGDIILKISGGDITEENYRDLFNGDQLTFTLGVAGEDGISAGSVMSLEAKELNLNPVLFTNIIEHDGHKIGYLFYAQFISDFNNSLDSVFQRFKEEQVTDIILDLRYNPGGGTNAAQYLCSSLAPLNVVRNSSTLVSFMWNDKYMDYFESVNSKEDLGIHFSLAVAHKMDLSRLTILTGRGTASASELTITGLKPYMDITTIGETTYGKYTASVTLKPEYYYDRSSDYAEFKNWGIQPIVLRYANSLGETDFKNGFTPDIYVKDELVNALPLGQKEEPLLKKAIEHITGSPVVAMKRAAIETEYRLFNRGFSKFDKNKMELLYEGFDSPGLK